MFPSQSRIGAVYNDGSYIIIFTGEEAGSQGDFYIIYNDDSYVPVETLTIIEDKYEYNIDLHFEISDVNDEPVDSTNMQPKADAGGPYYEIVNKVISFDGSASYDSDGTIVQYEWDFGDEEYSDTIQPTHIYRSSGNYKIILTVTDDKGKADIDITYAFIGETIEIPPIQPVLNGTLNGSTNTLYKFTIFSTDIENDTIQYVVDWGDKTSISSSHFLDSGTIFTMNHLWIYPGIYTVTAYSIDESNAVSNSTKIDVLIDTIYCKNIGYMIDYTNDGYYDLFHSNSTDEETPIEFISNKYLIDYDNDGMFEYEYNIETNVLNLYSDVNPEPEKSRDIFDLILPLFPYLIFGVMILILLITALLIIKRFKKRKKKIIKAKQEDSFEKQKPTKEKPKMPEKKSIKEPIESDYTLKNIRDKIDKL